MDIGKFLQNLMNHYFTKYQINSNQYSSMDQNEKFLFSHQQEYLVEYIFKKDDPLDSHQISYSLRYTKYFKFSFMNQIFCLKKLFFYLKKFIILVQGSLKIFRDQLILILHD